MDKKYTIKDIAELAEVSKGTVDRVLHRRGKVSEKAKQRVENILKEIDYQANPIARNLKNNKIYRICALLPDPELDSYWMPAVQGIRKAEKEFKAFGLNVSRFYYNPNERTSFIEKSKEALLIAPDALLMAPLFQEEALTIYNECKDSEILVALFNNDIDTFKCGNFIGQDLHQSGRVAASLIDKLVKKTAAIAVIHIDEEDNMKLRENGFKSFFEENRNVTKIKTYSLKTSNEDIFNKEASKIIKSNPDISAIFITNSKSHRFLEAIEHTCKDLVIVGYDLIEKNINYLNSGSIDFLIHQKPKRQAYLGVGYLAEHFLFGKTIPSQNLLPIDIITTENVSYYLE